MLPLVVRLGVPALCLVPLPFAIANRGSIYDATDLAVLAALLLGAAVITGLIVQRWSVTVTDRHLVVVTALRTTTVPWADISGITRQGLRLVVTWRLGYVVVPLLASTAGRSRGPSPAMTLGDAVMQRWSTCRGPQWFAVPPDPWRPTADARGRVVIRRSWQRQLAITSRLPVTMVGWFGVQIAFGLRDAGTVVVMAAQLTAGWLVLCLLDFWWSRTIIDDAGIVDRSLTGGIRRIRRGEIFGVTETPVRWLSRTSWALAVATSAGPRRLAAPRRSLWPGTEDPEFYRIWAWLGSELSRPTAAPERSDSSASDQPQ